MFTLNEDGTIKKVIPTLRGVGIVPAAEKIELDRYSAMSQTGAAIEFLYGREQPFKGWDTVLTEKGAWIQFNDVDFGAGDLKSLSVKALSEAGGTIELYVGNDDNPVKIEADIPKTPDWRVVNTKYEKSISGIRNIKLILKSSDLLKIDWIRFE